jgi:mycofactocin precursor
MWSASSLLIPRETRGRTRPFGDQEMRRLDGMHARQDRGGRRFRHLPDWPGITARSGSYRRAGRLLSLARASTKSVRKKGLAEMTKDTLSREDEDLVESDELLVDEVSIDGMCGVY